MMAYSEDHIALAAEYALGTLDADERAQVETMMSVDKEFTAMVEAWQQKLGVLNQMVGSVEPRPEVWDWIKTAIGHSEQQAPLLLPEHAAAAGQRRRRDSLCRSTIPTSSNCPPGPGAGAISRRSTTAMAAALIAMIATQLYAPDRLPDGLRPKVRTQVVEVKTTVAPPPSGQFVALLQKDSASPAFILTVDGASKNFTVRRVGATPEAGKSFELWLVSDKLPRRAFARRDRRQRFHHAAGAGSL